MKKMFKQLMAVLLVISIVVSLGSFEKLASAAVSMKISSSEVTVKVGESSKVTLKGAPDGSDITWTSDNAKVAKVKSGKITGVRIGATTVNCTVAYKLNPTNKSKVKKTFKINVIVKSASSETTNVAKSHKSANGITTKDNGQMRTELTSQDLISFMGQAWNLGNSLETSKAFDGKTVDFYETSAGNIQTTQAVIDGIKSYGFNTVRIPVAWSNMISDDGKYTIDTALLDRVETVMNYCFNNGMYVILNDHYDGGWWGQFGSADQAVRDEAWKRYESFWIQIADRYKEYSDRLIFEAANEELGDRLNDKIDGVAGVLKDKEKYQMVHDINQKFVDIVRASGGNNKTRHLLIAGYNTDITKSCDDRFVMPTDTKKNGKTKLSISVHYYTPSSYCIAESNQGYGYSKTWGKDLEIKELHTLFDKMTKFSDAGYGIIIGEYGVCSPNKDGIPTFLKEVITYSAKLGFCPVLWDNGIWYNRISGKFKYNDVAQVFIDATGSKAKLIDGGSVTGIPKLQIGDESTLKLVGTWEGTFTKNDGSNTNQFYEQKSCTDNLTVYNNSWNYYIYLTADWKSMKEPYIKVYVKDDGVSNTASLQLGYVDLTDGKIDNGNDVWNDKVEFQSTDGWLEKCIKLDKDNLDKYGVLFISSGNGPTITKIEIFDAAN